MKMSVPQFKRWMTAKTKQYVGLITSENPDHISVSFHNNFNRFPSNLKSSCGACCPYDNQILYRTDYIENGWDVNKRTMERLIVHEVCHLLYESHDNKFYTEYAKWSGDNFINRYLHSKSDYIKNGVEYVCAVKGLPVIEVKGNDYIYLS